MCLPKFAASFSLGTVITYEFYWVINLLFLFFSFLFKKKKKNYKNSSQRIQVPFTQVRHSSTNNNLNLLLFLPAWMCFFCRALEFWNHTCVTRLLRPVTEAIRSRSCPSGLLSSWKFACNTCSCSSVNVVRTRFALFLW